jgi:hypothetical protein
VQQGDHGDAGQVFGLALRGSGEVHGGSWLVVEEYFAIVWKYLIPLNGNLIGEYWKFPCGSLPLSTPYPV